MFSSPSQCYPQICPILLQTCQQIQSAPNDNITTEDQMSNREESKETCTKMTSIAKGENINSTNTTV